jgi:hypothetical protein
MAQLLVQLGQCHREARFDLVTPNSLGVWSPQPLIVVPPKPPPPPRPTPSPLTFIGCTALGLLLLLLLLPRLHIQLVCDRMGLFKPSAAPALSPFGPIKLCQLLEPATLLAEAGLHPTDGDRGCCQVLLANTIPDAVSLAV